VWLSRYLHSQTATCTGIMSRGATKEPYGAGWDGHGSRAQSSSSLSHTPLWCGVAPPENSVTNSRADCALTQQMVGCITAISALA
jgi:hypothetical protein